MRPDDIARTSVRELRRRFLESGEHLAPACAEALRGDERAGARALLEAIVRRREGDRAEARRLRRLLRYELPLWRKGLTRVAGVDEAGVAPLAGPVVAAAVVLPRAFRPAGIDDSKKLDRAARERLAGEIKAVAVGWALGLATAQEIDALNPYHAGLLAMRRAVQGLPCAPEHLLIDARRLSDLRVPQEGIVHGDARSLTIAAASILAKSARDAMMVEYDLVHPGYGFARHKGYPTAEHFAALGRLGPCAIHRRSFAPVRRAMGRGPVQQELFGAAPAGAAAASPEVVGFDAGDPRGYESLED